MVFISWTIQYMVARRYGISFPFNTISHPFAVLTRDISNWTLEEKLHIYARPCIIPYALTGFHVLYISCCWSFFFDTLGCLEKESSRSMSSKLRTLYPSMMPCKYASCTRKVRVLDIFSSCTNKNYKADFAYPIVGLLAERGKLPALSQRFWEFAPRRDLFSNLLDSPQLLQL